MFSGTEALAQLVRVLRSAGRCLPADRRPRDRCRQRGVLHRDDDNDARIVRDHDRREQRSEHDPRSGRDLPSRTQAAQDHQHTGAADDRRADAYARSGHRGREHRTGTSRTLHYRHRGLREVQERRHQSRGWRGVGRDRRLRKPGSRSLDGLGQHRHEPRRPAGSHADGAQRHVLRRRGGRHCQRGHDLCEECDDRLQQVRRP